MDKTQQKLCGKIELFEISGFTLMLGIFFKNIYLGARIKIRPPVNKK